MSGTQVQQKLAYVDAAGSTSITVTLDSTATSGNLLLAYLTVDKGSGAITVPTGFTLIHDFVGSDVSMAMAYKFSDGTETAITWNHATARTMKQAQVLEYSGLDTFDVAAEAASGATNVTSQTSGTTATTASASARAFALFSSDSKGNTDAGAAYTNSFTSTYTDPGGINTGCSGLYSSEKDLSATGAQETTFSTTGTGDQMAGMIAVFYQSSSGLSITPSGLSSAEAFGTAVIGRGAVSITPNGIASAEAFGTAVLSSLYTITANAIATAEAFGTAVISTGVVSVLPSGIATAEAIGAAVLSNGFAILPLSIESLEALGNPVLTVGNVTILPAGIASSETIGAAIVVDVIIVADIAFIHDLVQELVKDITGRLNG